MAIDSSALTSIKNAIASYSGSESTYSDKLKNDNYTYPSGTLEMPIRDDLYITIKW